MACGTEHNAVAPTIGSFFALVSQDQRVVSTKLFICTKSFDRAAVSMRMSDAYVRPAPKKRQQHNNQEYGRGRLPERSQHGGASHAGTEI